MGGPEALIPITFFTIIGIMVYIGVATRHKERMAMLEKGFTPDQMQKLARRTFRPQSPMSSLKWGIIIVAIGLAIIVANFVRNVYNVDESVSAGIVFLFAGSALLVFYAIAAKKLREPEQEKEE